MGKKQVCVIGHFAFSRDLLNGQTVKTKILASALEQHLGKDEVVKKDTHGGKKKLLSLPFTLLSALKNCHNVVILPAQNGLRVIAPLLFLLRPFFRGRRLHYSVIGGWLPSFLGNRPFLRRALKSFTGIYVETSTMKRALEVQGFSNVYVMPNGKELQILTAEERIVPTEMPYRLCTFSRVMREKGIEDAVRAVKEINTARGKTVYSLDIYGQVETGQEAWFDALKETFPPEIRYGGLVPFDKSVETINGSFALLFPTHFYTEGIPGTVIDAYAAGVPVIAAKWESFSDLIEDGVTGVGYTWGDENGLFSVLSTLCDAPERLSEMKEACAMRATQYTVEEALKPLLLQFDV